MYRQSHRVAGTVTIIGISLFFCAVVRFSTIMAPSLNDIHIQGCLVFHVVAELPTRIALFSIMAA